jgi:DNA-binding response OmpR family regulator
MIHKHICAHCGYDVTPDEPIKLGRFAMGGAQFQLFHDGKPIKLTNAENCIAWALLKGYPYAIPGSTLLNRMDSEGCDNTINAMVCKLRRKIREATSADPIETVWGRGYRWRPE